MPRPSTSRPLSRCRSAASRAVRTGRRRPSARSAPPPGLPAVAVRGWYTPDQGDRPVVARVRLRENLDAYVLIGPWLLGFLLLTAGPMLGSVVLALSDWDLLNAPRFIGLKNFPELWSDDLFWLSLYNTGYYTFISVPLHLVVALAAALILNLKLRWINYYRTMVYL